MVLAVNSACILNDINQQTFVMVMGYSLFDVQTEFFNITYKRFGFKRLITFPIYTDYTASNDKLILNELEVTWKETITAYITVISQHLPEGTKKTIKTPSQDSFSLGTL
jgi:hypothetical protein